MSIPSGRLTVGGPARLHGSVAVQGSKNAAQKLIPAAAAIPGRYRLDNVPEIEDTEIMLGVLSHLGGKVDRSDRTVVQLDTTALEDREISSELSRLGTGTFMFAGALLARFGHARICHPGGDRIGARPVGLHLDAFRALGVTVRELDCAYDLTATRLRPTTFKFAKRTVNGTVNALLAVVLSGGGTQLQNVAVEPDIENVVDFLNSAGARLRLDHSSGTLSVKAAAVPIGEARIAVTPDRNDAATFAVAASLAGDTVELVGIGRSDIESLCSLLERVGIRCLASSNGSRPALVLQRGSLKAIDDPVESGPYPGLSTDWGPQIQVLLSQLPAPSEFHETIFSNRFAHVAELSKMGLDAVLVTPDGTRCPASEFSPHATYTRLKICGPNALVAARVTANDIRGGAALVLAGLAASGTTVVEDSYQVRRGYSRFAERLSGLGADISDSVVEPT
jgi:UDP-N-acetylglucosamine 1-carboxyvinyltransferase